MVSKGISFGEKNKKLIKIADTSFKLSKTICHFEQKSQFYVSMYFTYYFWYYFSFFSFSQVLEI